MLLGFLNILLIFMLFLNLILHVCHLKLFIVQYQDLLDPCAVLKPIGPYIKCSLCNPVEFFFFQNVINVGQRLCPSFTLWPDCVFTFDIPKQTSGRHPLKAQQSEIFSISFILMHKLDLPGNEAVGSSLSLCHH